MLSAAPLTVPAGARATLGEGLTIAGTTTANLSYTLIEVQGALVMLDGATVRDATNYTTNNAPIHVSGAGATFVMRGGEIRDNHSHRQAGRAAGALKVDTGGRAELLGGVIRDNSARTGGGDGSGAVLIGPGGSGVLDGTVISGNASSNGAGVNVVSFDRFDVSSPEERAAKAARFEIFSGTIEGNTASNGGGGVSVMGNAHVTMSGGTISGNSARGGGGVNVWDLCYAGDASGARTDLYCAHYGIDFEDWRNLYAGEFTLTGGEITDNTASSTGGGINIVSDNVTLAGGDDLRQLREAPGRRRLRHHGALHSTDQQLAHHREHRDSGRRFRRLRRRDLVVPDGRDRDVRQPGDGGAHECCGHRRRRLRL